MSLAVPVRWRTPLKRVGHWLFLLAIAVALGSVAARSTVLALMVAGGIVMVLVGVMVLHAPRLVVLSLSFLLVFQTGFEVAFGANVSPHLAALSWLLVTLIMVAVGPRNGRVWRTPYLWSVFVYVVVGAVALVRGPEVQGGAQTIWATYRLILSAPIMYVATWTFLEKPVQIRQALALIGIGAALGGLVSLVQFLTNGRLLTGLGQGNYRYLGLFHRLPAELVATFEAGTNRGLFLRDTGDFRGHGPFPGPNSFGVFLSVAICLTWGLLITSRGGWRWLWGGVLLCQLVGLVATISRSAWGAVFVGGCLFLLWYLREGIKRPLVLVGLVSAVLLTGLSASAVAIRSPIFFTHFTSIFSPNEVGEFRWRLRLWTYAMEQVGESPWLGTGTTKIAREAVGLVESAAELSAHNLLIDILYQRGVIVATIYVLLWLFFFYKGWRLLRISQAYHSPLPEPLVVSLLIGGVAFWVSGIGTAAMTYYNLALLNWFLLASMFSLYQWAKRT